MKGPSMSSNEFRNMIQHVIMECEQNQLNILVTAADGQWHNYGVRDKENRPLTLIQLQREVWAETRRKNKSNIVRELKLINSVDVTKLEQCFILEKREGTGIHVSGHILYGHIPTLRPSMIHYFTTKHAEKTNISSDDTNLFDSSCQFENIIPTTTNGVLDMESVSAVETALHEYHLPPTQFREENLTEALADALHILYAEESVGEMYVDETRSESNIDNEMKGIWDDGISHTRDMLATLLPDVPIREDSLELGFAELEMMKNELAKIKEPKRPDWANMTVAEFGVKFATATSVYKTFTRKELITCLKPVIDKLKGNGIKSSLSWPKQKLVDLFSRLLGDHSEIEIKTRKQNFPASLQSLSMKTISSKYPKELLNEIMAEYTWIIELQKWRSNSIINQLQLHDTFSIYIEWFSKPNVESGKMLFHFTDACHILTCLHSKVCTTGIAGLRKSAWRDAALSPQTKLNISMVDECVDKQSVQFAKTVFAADVQEYMLANGYEKEFLFCERIHDWFQAEDDPGISAMERCMKRLKLRDGIHFGHFPPKTGYIKGIPIVTYEGLLVNIERKLMMFPFCDGQFYNARATGSQEIEQFFGTFRDMDPSGSGTPKPDDIPMMFWKAIEICNCRFDSSRAFYMATSKATVYPEVIFSNKEPKHHQQAVTTYLSDNCFRIYPRDHFFDMEERTRVKQKQKKKSSICSPHQPSCGERGVRQYYRTDESKLLPHLRRGLPDIPD